MTPTILADASAAPALFRWNDPIDRGALVEHLFSRGWTIPEDLIDFWAITGGGEIFETELLLRPVAPMGQASELEQTQRFWHERGLPVGSVVFHEGFIVTAVAQNGMYLSFDRDLQPSGQFISLEDWYVGAIRAEYAERYGLPPLPIRLE